MEKNDNVLVEINIPTHELNIKALQNVLKIARENYHSDNKDFWNQLSNILWNHLQTGFTKFDDQLLSATCFYTVMTLTDKQGFYLAKILQIIEKELFIKRCNEILSTKTYLATAMMYGMFQSTFLLQNTDCDVAEITSVLKPIFDLLILMGYEYSQYTFISFKTIKLFKKVCGTNLQECIFCKENQIKLLTFINHNWENPVTGIRDLNRSIFQTLISTLDDSMYETVLKEINGFYWNKAKYLMLSEIIEYHKGNLFSLLYANKWVDGLKHSLHKPGLVSAGADMYYALLKRINFEEEWCKLFMYHVIGIVNGSSSKAIVNFNNFWCLTTLKKFPSLSNILLDELKNLKASDLNLCSQLCIMKQANKLGIIHKNWSSTSEFNQIAKTVLYGIEHCNYYIRLTAFDIVCVSPRKSVPSQLEYKIILDYLHNNVNSDCTVLRLSMLNSFNHFLTHLHSIFLNVMIKDESNIDLQNLLKFCKKLQDFLVNSINLNGNYQRKITCVKLCYSIMTCLSQIPKKKRDQTRQANKTLMGYVKEQGYWLLSTKEFVLKLVSLLKDPTDEVRENVIKLLLDHYSEELSEPNVTKHLVDDALKSMKSKFFYEISCGQSMFKLLCNLVMKEQHCIMEYKSVEDIFYFAYNELVAEHRDKRNIMESIEIGKQLHSFISILLVVLETCISSSYEIDIYSMMPELVSILKSVSDQFGWEVESSTSSDFSKMSDMVENIIGNYASDPADDNDHSKISGLHQIVLNCLWLNVKASCDLASILVQFNLNDVSMCEKCLNINTHVLETSRHKGAIEAAGASLGKGIQFLTSLPAENKASEVPFMLLKCKLDDLISETNKMSSITRRGAGLSIMVHRIVSSDMKKGKPLFHYFINTLLQLCNSTKDTPVSNNENIENQIDLPKAIYIHFLTRIVTDSSLASDMMFYFANLAELAFRNLTSSHWQIRNAALQLYGALIPKQIGEKKASGSDEETTAAVAYDELRTHSPKLWKYVMEQIKQSNQIDKVQVHSNLVPILNLLANIAKRYNFTHNTTEQKTEDEDLINHLFLLLNSPINTVRRLTAKCIFNIYEFDSICEILLTQDYTSENFLHGSLYLLNLVHKYYASNTVFKENFEKVFETFRRIISTNNHSYLCKSLFESICNDGIGDIERIVKETNSNVYAPGIHLWAETRIKEIINICLWDEIPALLNILLKQSDYAKYCELIFMKIKTHDSIPRTVLLEVVNTMLLFEKKYSSSIIWKVIYELSLKMNLSGHLNIMELLKMFEQKESIYKLRYIIPLVARNISHAQSETKINLLNIIKNLCDFENSDVDMRYIAAIANNELANDFNILSDPMKVTSIKCAVLLLQDEDEDVRNLSVNFYARISKQDAVVQPYICLNNILNRTFLATTFVETQSSIQELVNELSEILQSNHSINTYNPFANDSKNIYLEPGVLKQLIENLVNV